MGARIEGDLPREDHCRRLALVLPGQSTERALGSPRVMLSLSRLVDYFILFYASTRRPAGDTATTESAQQEDARRPSLFRRLPLRAEFGCWSSFCCPTGGSARSAGCSTRARLGGVPLHSKKTYLLKLQIKLKTKKTKSIRALSFVGRVSTGGRQLAPVDSRERRSTPWALPGGRCARGGPRRAVCTFGTI